MLEFYVVWFDDVGNPVDTEFIKNNSKAGAIARIGGRFVNRTEPSYACGFFLRERRPDDTVTLQGTLQQRKGRGEPH
jgi:hypothetical protein